jgi:cation diffusion facilitator CzcD-associated flavoprotein CzcO
MEQVDVLVVGAGISGVAAGYHLQTQCPDKSYCIFEGRGAIGGTWDLFRYPGIRSDSDMFTLGFSFRPWKGDKAIAEGADIRAYVQETAAEYGIDDKIRFHHMVESASWSSKEAKWTVRARRTDTDEIVEIVCNFLFMCAGYYAYEEGYTPDFPGLDDFRGTLVHPQKWPEELDCSGKRVVVIGSGATAVTLVPALAERGAEVVMLQRSPSYILARPDEDAIAQWLRDHLPEKAAYMATRWKNVALGMLLFEACRRYPERMTKLLLRGVREELGDDFDVEKHFTPHYNPWEQRLCLAPHGDILKAIKAGKVEVVTDHIERFTDKGIALRSGEELEADIIVTATGLKLRFLGGLDITVDGHGIDPSELVTYRGCMLSDVPNLAMAFGYTNASWTLKCDLIADYVCRLLNHMDHRGYRKVVPRPDDPNMSREPLVDFSSGYFQRSLHELPKQGERKPWRLYQNYFKDLLSLRMERFRDDALEMTS